jgi:putative tsp protein
VRADVHLPPPTAPAQQIATVPNGSSIDFKNGKFILPEFNKNSPGLKQFQEAQRGKPLEPFTAQKSNPSVLRDGYGNAATGRINSQTTVGSSVMNQAVNGYIAGQMAGSVLNSPGAQNAAKQTAAGNYGEAAISAAAAFDVFGVGQGINNLYEIFRDAQQKKIQEAAAKAAAMAQQNEKAATEGRIFFAVLDTATDPGINNEKGAPVIDGYWINEGSPANRGNVMANGKPFHNYLKPLPLKPNGDGTYQYVWIQPMKKGYVPPPILKPEEVILNQQQMQQAMIDALNKNTVTQDRLTQLINALWASGQLNPANTQTTVVGGDAANTFTTAPYTPAGANEAQQTQFIVQQNGNVIVNTIKRPDLVSNSSQAPTRAEVGQTQTAPETRPQKEGSTAEKPDICAQNPNSLMCAEGGNADYEDVAVPHQDIPLDFSPADIFATDGVCPEPRYVDLGIYGKQEFSYDGICDLARKLRPLFILSTILACAYFIYASLDR